MTEPRQADSTAVSSADGGQASASATAVSSRDERLDVDDLAALALAELHRAVDQREQRVVATDADVLAGVEPGAALADDDRAGVDLAVPPNTLTPRRCALESRPLRVEPPPLVFDMVGQPFLIEVISTTWYF